VARAGPGWLIAVALALSVLSAGPARAQPFCLPTVWCTEYAPAMEGAHRAGRPVVLYFALPLDATSHEAFVRLRRDPDLVQAMHPFVRIFLEQDDLEVAWGKYRVNEFPAIVVLDPDGRKIGLITVDPDSDRWMQELKHACHEAMSRAILVMEPPPPPPPTHSLVAPAGVEPPRPMPPPPALHLATPPLLRRRFPPLPPPPPPHAKARRPGWFATPPPEKPADVHREPASRTVPPAGRGTDGVGAGGPLPPWALRAGAGDIRWPGADAVLR